MPGAEGADEGSRKAHERENEMNDLKALTECSECTWDYIDRLRMALTAACKERDELKKAYDAMARDLQFRAEQVRELHEENARLKKYEDAEKDGRLVVLPVKKGTQIFRVVDIPEHECQGRMRGHYFPATKRIYKGVMQWEDGPNFCKTVFLTREEAEAALKGGEG